jgi:heme/copper-type cytochrome/quinol oxidase subunit 3
MILEPRFTDDLADLPTHKFGTSSLTWWGIIGFMVIEGGFFMLTFAAYFFLMGHEQGWPPEGRQPADILAGTLFTIVILLSEIPNSMIKKAAQAGDIPAIRRLILVMTAVGAVLLVIRGFEFNSLNCRWTDDAYGSIIWALLLLHTTHLITDWGDTVVLAALMHTRVAYEGRRQVDVDENSLYWRYVWLLWIPIYLMIYWVPRL